VGRDRDVEMKDVDKKSVAYIEKLGSIFGERVDKMTERLRAKSIFGGLKTWRLLHMMVKTGDNLKQEQFALQLITQFNYIFKLESVKLLLTPYEVISMGPDCGVMEMIRDTVTMDGLLKKLKEDHPRIHSIKEFFEAYYVEDLHKVKMRFTRSLAAYSLVMYFMQVKDRHNGNILLHREGKLIHIDFGFFLSNAPGKGV
jgi:phosphatidylinositol kinase/protein kinase (PI-3  family)